jgi:hypothetical protein
MEPKAGARRDQDCRAGRRQSATYAASWMLGVLRRPETHQSLTDGTPRGTGNGWLETKCG